MPNENNSQENLDNIDEKDTQPLGASGPTGPSGDGATGPSGPSGPTGSKEEEPIDVDKIVIKTRARPEEKVEYGDDIDPDDAKTIGAIVEKQISGTKKVILEQQDKLEVDAFIAEKPEFAKYKPVILKYMNYVNPETGRKAFESTAIKDLAFMAAGDDLLKIGAKMEREAQAKADATKSGGSPVRKSQGGQTDWGTAPKEAFEAQKQRVLQGGA